jgi:hypothetical protein
LSAIKSGWKHQGGEVMKLFSYFALSILLFTILLITPAYSQSNIRYCGLTIDKLLHGFSLTENGIVFPSNISADVYAIYEHIPNAEDDLIVPGSNFIINGLEFIYDIKYTDNFILKNKNGYFIVSYDLSNHTGFEIPDDQYIAFLSAFALGDKYIIFTAHEDVEDQIIIPSLYIIDSEGQQTDRSDIINSSGSPLLWATMSADGLLYLVYKNSLILFNLVDSSSQTYMFPSEMIELESCQVELSGERIFILDDPSDHIYELLISGDEIRVVKDMVVPPSMMVLIAGSNVYISTCDSKLINWDTYEIYDAHYSSAINLPVGDVIYVVQINQILVPYNDLHLEYLGLYSESGNCILP